LEQNFIDGKFFAKNLKYVLGEVKLAKSRFGSEVEKVVTSNNVSEIAKILREFTNKKLQLAKQYIHLLAVKEFDEKTIKIQMMKTKFLYVLVHILKTAQLPYKVLNLMN